MTSFDQFKDLQLCFSFLDYKDVLSAHIRSRFFLPPTIKNGKGQTKQIGQTLKTLKTLKTWVEKHQLKVE